MFRSAVRYLSSSSSASAAAASATGAGAGAGAGSGAAPVTVPITTAAKQLRPLDMSRSKRKNIIKKEQRMKRQIIRDVNNAKKMELRNVSFAVDPILGHPKNQFMHRIKAELAESTNLANGYQQQELEKLMYGAEKAAITKNSISSNNSILFNSITEMESKKRSAVLTILNMNNSNEQDKKKLSVKLAREAFQREEGDTGSPEVQAAILTVKIHQLMDHIKRNFKDKVNIQRVRQMVQKRQSLLKYLKKDDPENYFYTIKKLGLTDDVIVREFNMSKQYMQDYNLWEDKVLVKLSDKEKEKLKKIDALKKKVGQYRELAQSKAAEIAKFEEQKAIIRAQRKAESSKKK